MAFIRNNITYLILKIMKVDLSPKGCSFKPVGLSSGLILGDFPDEVLPELIEQELEQSKRYDGHAKVHEDIVPSSESPVERLEVGCSQD